MKKKLSLRLALLTLVCAMTVSIGLTGCSLFDKTPSTPADSSSPSDSENGDSSSGNGDSSSGNGGDSSGNGDSSSGNGGDSSGPNGIITTPDLEF